MKKPNNYLEQAVKESLQLKRKFFQENQEKILAFYRKVRKAFREDAQVLVFGNGGSAADAQHFAAELMHRVEKKRIAMRALALHTDTSLVTALSNDEGFHRVFARQIEVLARPGDLAVAISTSGVSTNIVEALKMARQQKCDTVGLLGRSGGEARKLCNLALVVPHHSTPRIQEVHGMILHLVCQLMEQD